MTRDLLMGLAHSPVGLDPVKREELARARTPRLLRLMGEAAWRIRNRCLLAGGWLASMLIMFAGHSWAAMGAALGTATAYGLLVFRDMFNPALIRSVHGLDQSDGEPDLSMPLDVPLSLDAVTPESHRDLLRNIVFTHEAIRTRLLLASPAVREALADPYQRCTEMARTAFPLAVRGQRLSSYISRFDERRLLSRICELRFLAESSADRTARAVFARACTAKERHVDSYRQVCGLCDRIRAQLTVINISMQNVEASLVRMISCDGDLEELASIESLGDLADQLSLDLACVDISAEVFDNDLYLDPWAGDTQ